MPLSSLNPRDVVAIDLCRVLSRLEHKILSADTADARLQHSSYERTKTSAVISPYLPFQVLCLCSMTMREADYSQIRISNTPALSCSASSIPLRPLNSPPKKHRLNPPSQRNVP